MNIKHMWLDAEQQTYGAEVQHIKTLGYLLW